MKVDLREIPVFVISDDPRRKTHIQAELNRVEIKQTFVKAIRCTPRIIGCGLSHLKAIQKVLPPFLLLEDDCSVTEAFKPIVDIPSSTDAVYLGVSTWGIVPSQPRGVNFAARSTVIDQDWLQIHNMLSAHAVLYLNPDYVDHVEEAILQHIFEDVPFDIGLAKLQRYHRVLTPKEPFFYQDARMGGQEDATKKALVI